MRNLDEKTTPFGTEKWDFFYVGIKKIFIK